MKQVLNFVVYALLFFVVIFAILYGGEMWVFQRGKPMTSMLIDSGVAAVVFAVFLCMVINRSNPRKKEGPPNKK